MQLSELLHGVPHSTELTACTLSALTADSRQVGPGAVFVCLRGLRVDGHDHAAQAIASGAVAVVVERDLGLPRQVLVDSTQAAFGPLCANFFGHPADRLKIIGVTGTNGKTTCTYLLKHVLEHAGHTVGLIGTIHNEIADMTIPAKYTTPDPMTLQAMLARMVQAGCDYVVMEVSSHALAQHRVDSLAFEAGIFTNLTQDHLDYHGDMQSYFAAKKMLFDRTRIAVINFDDPYGKELLGDVPCRAVSYSVGSDFADYTAREATYTVQGSQFLLLSGGGIERMRIRQPGQFSVANAMAVAACCIELGIPVHDVRDALATCPGVTGRFEILPTGTDYTVIRDYAHTPDGIEKVLTAVRAVVPQGARVLTLFGCAGERDRTKRPAMGSAAAALSDFCILTSDNPRSEDPDQIISDTLPGILEHGTEHITIADRYDATRWALASAKPGDVLMLLGKGHEDYQVLSYGTIYFDEKEVVRSILAGEQRPPKVPYTR